MVLRNSVDEIDEILSLLSDSRRRFAVYCLLSNKCTNLNSLAVQIAAWENDETVESVSEDAYESVKISMYHNHLPRLAEHDIVEFDGRNGDVVRSDGLSDIEPFVEQIRKTDGYDADRCEVVC